MTHTILIVDDEADIRNLVKGILEDEGYNILTAGTSDDAYKILEKESPHLVILDIWLQGSKHDGLQILEQSTQRYPHIPIIMISGHGTIETAVAAIKQGAYDFIEKPFKADRLLLMARRALEAAALKRENIMLKKQAQGPVELIGASPFVKNLQEVLKRVCASNSRVLLSGEAGTGKGIVARYIHQHSERAEQPFLVLNCATLRPDHLEKELFGDGDAVGALEAAHKGTLFLDEISDMPLETQGKFLRVLQDQRFQRPSDRKEINVDLRIIAASNRDLQQAMEDGFLREDLYYRLNVVPIEMLPLRERVQDVENFATYFLQGMFKKAGLPHKGLNIEAIRALSAYQWPGNIRQLKNVLEWMMIMHGGISDQNFGVEHLPPDVSGRDSQRTSVHTLHGADALDSEHIPIADFLLALPLRDAREAFERAYLFAQVEKFDGNISKTAQFIGMERSALHRKIKSLQLSEGAQEEAEISSEVSAEKKTA